MCFEMTPVHRGLEEFLICEWRHVLLLCGTYRDFDRFAQSIEGRSGGGPLTRRGNTVSQSIEDID